MLLSFILFVVGLAILIKSADWLVSGASSLAAKFNVSPMVIGLTVVAFGTSAPELVVSVTSALENNTQIALSNIIGSNIANILLIIGLSAMIYPLTVQRNTVWKEIPMSFLGAIVLTVLALQDAIDLNRLFEIPLSGNHIVGMLTTSNGIILLAFFIIFLYYTFGIAKVNADTEEKIEKRTLPISISMVVIGLAGLMLGSKLLVDNSITLAKAFGVSDAFIGLTLVAVGTSLPELITSVVAATKKQVDIAVGNVVGSNIFNIFLILGVTAIVKPIPLLAQNIFDILVLFAATIILFVSLFIMQKRTIGKIEGSFMLASYVAYIGFLVTRG